MWMGMNRREREKERVTPMHARPTSTPYFHAKLVCAPRVRGDIERQLRSAWMRMFGKESPSKAGTDGRGEEGEDKQKGGRNEQNMRSCTHTKACIRERLVRLLHPAWASPNNAGPAIAGVQRCEKLESVPYHTGGSNGRGRQGS